MPSLGPLRGGRARNVAFFGRALAIVEALATVSVAKRRKPAPKSWVGFITSIVDGHRVGPPEDDVLVATLTFRATDAGRDDAAEAP